MRIFVSHSSGFDYHSELYLPLKNSQLFKEHTFILPHDKNLQNTKEQIKNCDLFIVEASFPSTGSGIEIGWADSFGKPICVFYRKGSKPSSSLKLIADKLIEYHNMQNFISKLREIIGPETEPS